MLHMKMVKWEEKKEECAFKSSQQNFQPPPGHPISEPVIQKRRAQMRNDHSEG